MPFYYYFDWSYLVLVVPALLFSLWASARVNSTFKKYSAMRNARGMTGAEAARAVLNANGVTDVRIEYVSGNLTDHYDPKNKVIRLSQDVYDAATPAAVGVAAHEAGHAAQYAANYLPIRIRAAIIPATNIGSKLSVPLIILGLLLPGLRIFAPYTEFFNLIAWIGVACYSLCVLFQLVTLPTEFNASRRAVTAIERCGLLLPEEQQGAKKVLKAAALTYVAALSASLAQLLRLIIIVGGRQRRD
jgi:Zn-dependent membrane protease YugP